MILYYIIDHQWASFIIITMMLCEITIIDHPHPVVGGATAQLPQMPWQVCILLHLRGERRAR